MNPDGNINLNWRTDSRTDLESSNIRSVSEHGHSWFNEPYKAVANPREVPIAKWMNNPSEENAKMNRKSFDGVERYRVP